MVLSTWKLILCSNCFLSGTQCSGNIYYIRIFGSYYLGLKHANHAQSQIYSDLDLERPRNMYWFGEYCQV